MIKYNYKKYKIINYSGNDKNNYESNNNNKCIQ